MAFSDFLDLRTAVVEFTGNPDIAEIFPRLVKLAEVEFNRRIRAREQIESTTLTVSSGSASLPADYQEAIGLMTSAGEEYVAMPSPAYHRLSRKTGFYTIEGSSLYASDAEYTFRYYKTIPTITDSMTDDNWLLSKHPNLYLYAVAFEAARNMRDLEMANTAFAFREQEFSQVAAQDDSERFARARVRVGGVTP